MSATTRKKRITITAIVTAALVLGGGGAAFAYWTSTGFGTGSAQTGTSTPFDVTSDPSNTPALTPGGPTQTVTFKVTNPGTATQKLTAVAVTVATGADALWSITGCSAADYEIGDASIDGGFRQIAGSGEVFGSVTIKMKNGDYDQNACKGVNVPLYFSAS